MLSGFLPKMRKSYKGEFFMKSFIKLFVLIAVIAVMFSACTTVTSIGGTADPQALISSTSVITEGRTEIGSYNVILGIVATGYGEYAAAVEKAIAAGKHVTSKTVWYFVVSVTTAYAK